MKDEAAAIKVNSSRNTLKMLVSFNPGGIETGNRNKVGSNGVKSKGFKGIQRRSKGVNRDLKGSKRVREVRRRLKLSEERMKGGKENRDSKVKEIELQNKKERKTKRKRKQGK